MKPSWVLNDGKTMVIWLTVNGKAYFYLKSFKLGTAHIHPSFTFCDLEVDFESEENVYEYQLFWEVCTLCSAQNKEIPLGFDQITDTFL